MAQAFSAKKYFSKISSPLLLTEFYKSHNITALFETQEDTPRKALTTLFVDFYTSLSQEEKQELLQDFTLALTLSTKYTTYLFSQLTQEHGISSITEIECKTDHDVALYYLLKHRDIFDEALFFNEFYATRSYMLYEAQEVDKDSAVLALTELTKEFKRITTKDEDSGDYLSLTHKTLNGNLFVKVEYDGKQILTKNSEEEETWNTKRKREELKIVYLREDKEVLLFGTMSRYEKNIFLDTFLRVVCKSMYEGKVESFNLSQFLVPTFDFASTNKGVPLLSWKVKGVTLSFGNEKAKKRLKLTIPSTVNERGLAPMLKTFEEMGIDKDLSLYRVEGVTLGFAFSHIKNKEKSAPCNCTVSLVKSSLLPLLPYERYARTLLKLASIDQGFVEETKKEKTDVTKKWEV